MGDMIILKEDNVKIVQIVTDNVSELEARIIGLGDDGKLYEYHWGNSYFAKPQWMFFGSNDTSEVGG